MPIFTLNNRSIRLLRGDKAFIVSILDMEAKRALIPSPDVSNDKLQWIDLLPSDVFDVTIPELPQTFQVVQKARG